jgi:hypothetical protein
VAPPGRIAWDVHLPLVTFARGEARGVLRGDERAEPPLETRRVSFEGLSGGFEDPTRIAAPVPPFWWEGSLRYGLFRPCEVGALLGFFRLGGELRCGLLDETRGAPFSLAAAAGGAFLPFYGRGGPWWRAGLDLSRQHQRLLWMLNPYVSRGPEGHQMLLEDYPADYLDTGPDPTHSYNASPYLQVVRSEWRLAAAVGVGFLTGSADEETGLAVILGLVPYVTLDADRAEVVDCHNCSALGGVRFAEDFGLTLTVGVTGPVR